MSKREAYFHTYAVFSFTRGTLDDPKHVLTTPRHAEARESAKASEWGEVRIIYYCRVPLHAANRSFICGHVDTLRALDSKRRKR